MPTGECLSCRKVLEVLVVCDNVDCKRGSLKIMTPVSKGIINSKKLLIVHVIVEFWRGERSALECDRMKLPVISENGENGCNCILRCVGLGHDLAARNPVLEDWCHSECVISVQPLTTSGYLQQLPVTSGNLRNLPLPTSRGSPLSTWIIREFGFLLELTLPHHLRADYRSHFQISGLPVTSEIPLRLGFYAMKDY